MNYFSDTELNCQHCGAKRFDPVFLDTLNNIRSDLGFALTVTSGYRCVDHPIESKKIEAGKPPGAHAYGKAVDIAIQGDKAIQLISTARKYGIKRIGVSQTGSKRFIHLDCCTSIDGFPSPALWTY